MQELEMLRREHVNKHLIHFSELTVINTSDLFPMSAFWTLDTESCKHELDHNEERVYAWIINNTENDNAIWGVEISDMFDTLNYLVDMNLINNRTRNPKKLEKLHKAEIFVHNLGWDIEFMKYYLYNRGLKYFRNGVKNNSLLKDKQPCDSFTIVENRNNVYEGTIIMQGRKCANTFKFYDSYKIMSRSLEDIGNKVIHIHEMFRKLGAKYDYESIRPLNHNLTDFEKMYLYNDGYILKEFIRQFYLPMNTNKKTASGISFEFFLQETYGQGTNAKNYAMYEANYPVIKNALIKEIIDTSYTGGFTQANRKYVGKIVECNGASVDINSSYPSVVKYKPLPYGEPKLVYGKPKYDDVYTGAILTIEFDGFRNNHMDDVIGKIKVGAKNTDAFHLSGNEYANTNFIDGKIVGGNNKSENHLYRLSFWDFELESLLKNMTFFTYPTKKCPFTGEQIKSGKIQKGYNIIYSTMFKMNVGHFGQAVDKCMEEKNKGKAEGNTCMSENGKLKANSFYGKCGSTDEREMRNLVMEENGLLSYESDGTQYLSDKKYYKAFASCVTAHARVNLTNVLYQVGYNNVVYWDTDSLYTLLSADKLKEILGYYAEYDKEGKITKVLNPNGKLDKYKLGLWDIEKEYTKIKAIGAKKYIVYGRDYGSTGDMKITCKCAGLPSDVRKTIDFDSFYLGNTFQGKKAKKKVKGGYRLETGSFTLNNTIY